MAAALLRAGDIPTAAKIGRWAAGQPSVVKCLLDRLQRPRFNVRSGKGCTVSFPCRPCTFCVKRRLAVVMSASACAALTCFPCSVPLLQSSVINNVLQLAGQLGSVALPLIEALMRGGLQATLQRVLASVTE